MRGLGKPGVHQVKWLEWNLFSEIYPDAVSGRGYSASPAARRSRSSAPGPQADCEQKKMSKARHPRICWSSSGRRGAISCRRSRQDIRGAGGAVQDDGDSAAAVHPEVPCARRHLDGHVEWWGLYSFCGPAKEQWTKHEFPAPGCSNIHMIWTDSPCMVTCWNDGFRFVKAHALARDRVRRGPAPVA